MFGRESQLPQNLLSEHFSLSGQVENKNNNNNDNLGDLNLHDIVGITNKFQNDLAAGRPACLGWVWMLAMLTCFCFPFAVVVSLSLLNFTQEEITIHHRIMIVHFFHCSAECRSVGELKAIKHLLLKHVIGVMAPRFYKYFLLYAIRLSGHLSVLYMQRGAYDLNAQLICQTSCTTHAHIPLPCGQHHGDMVLHHNHKYIKATRVW